ncbi:MAG: hypothetical protein DI598_02935 [Pseudopedobacter saltans]|uniref:Glycerophosphoryl diester phosphodiesterase membrane domain-containing protein n=1 Tax=Pseudopedobacter saltans TaxID=151895 RepID=A0A2W5F6B0_9SPHI|nr:MAG: hypothetical protein DI598_02935 [Pseudopedobacter saltans]
MAAGVLNGLYSRGFSGIWSSIINGTSYDEYDSLSTVYSPFYFLTIFFSLLTQMIVYGVVACYLKLYEQNGNTSPNLDEVWTVFRKNILYLVFYGLILGILVGLGFILCLFPGFYLYTVFAPFGFIVVVEEDKSLGSIFGRCFVLIKENFWPSLGLYVLSGFIYTSCASIIGIVVGGITGLLSYFTTKDIGFVSAMFMGIVQVFSSAFSILLYLAIGIQYFSLEEKSNGTGLMTRIQNMDNGFNTGDDEDRATTFIKD